MREGTFRGGGSPTTRWRAVVGPPARRLRHAVISYAEYEEFSTAPVARRSLPGPASVLIIELAEPLFAAGAAETGAMRAMTAFLAAPGRGPATTWHSGFQHCLELRLTLLGAYRLFGTLAGFPGRAVPLDAVWGPAAPVLTERLAAAPGWAERFDLLDDALEAVIARGPEPDPEIAHALARLHTTGGDLVVGDLVRETGWSRGKLAARFRQQTGLTPKTAATLVRFARGVDLLDEDRALASVATTCGYYDQAHFNRDFRAFAGCSPTEWTRSRLTGLLGTGVP